MEALGLARSGFGLRVESRGKADGGPQESAELLPEDQGNLGAPVGDHIQRDTMEMDYMGKEQMGRPLGRRELDARSGPSC